MGTVHTNCSYPWVVHMSTTNTRKASRMYAYTGGDLERDELYCIIGWTPNGIERFKPLRYFWKWIKQLNCPLLSKTGSTYGCKHVAMTEHNREKTERTVGRAVLNRTDRFINNYRAKQASTAPWNQLTSLNLWKKRIRVNYISSYSTISFTNNVSSPDHCHLMIPKSHWFRTET